MVSPDCCHAQNAYFMGVAEPLEAPVNACSNIFTIAPQPGLKKLIRRRPVICVFTAVGRKKCRVLGHVIDEFPRPPLSFHPLLPVLDLLQILPAHDIRLSSKRAPKEHHAKEKN